MHTVKGDRTHDPIMQASERSTAELAMAVALPGTLKKSGRVNSAYKTTA